MKSVQDTGGPVDHRGRMVQAFTVTRVLDHPTDEVWRQLTDWERAAGWLGVDSIRADGPTAVGTTLHFVTRGRERAGEVTALDPGRSITLRSRQGGVVADYTYGLVPEGAGTRVTLVADVRTEGVWRLAGPAIRAAVRRPDGGQLDALGRRLARR